MRIQRLYRFTSPALIVATAALLAACSTPGPMQSSTGPGDLPAGQVPGKPEVTPQMAAAAEVLQRMATQHDRLYRVAAPLLIDNAALCT